MPSAQRSRRAPTPAPDGLDTLLAAAGFALDLLDGLPDVVFFAKDAEGRYRAVNDTLVRRLGKRTKRDLVGRTACDLFPSPLGERYLEQDLAVCRTGRPVEDLLELHLYPDGREGWCLTTKLPMRDGAGRIVGLAGTSRDVRPPDVLDDSVEGLAGVLSQLHDDPAGPHRVEELARQAGLSPARFSRRIRALFGVSAAQLVVKVRIDAARRMLLDRKTPIAGIALACGYCDQSAFTRQFKAVTGLTPAQYRESP